MDDMSTELVGKKWIDAVALYQGLPEEDVTVVEIEMPEGVEVLGLEIYFPLLRVVYKADHFSVDEAGEYKMVMRKFLICKEGKRGAVDGNTTRFVGSAGRLHVFMVLE